MTQPLVIRLWSETKAGEPVLLNEWAAYAAPEPQDIVAIDGERYEVLAGREWIPRSQEGMLNRTIVELVGKQL